MKLLRILTGVHAGAQLQLTPGTHRIGADDDADIRLTDWRGADALLHLDATGVVSAQRVAAAPDVADAATADSSAAASAESGVQPEEVILLVDFVPMQFDDMILCVGADDVAWPSDLDLLSTLLTRPAEAKFAAERRKRRRYTGAVAACFVLGVVIVAASLLTTTQMSSAAPPRNADDRAQRVTEALAAAHVGGLKARALGNTVVVTGMVLSSADDDAVRALLDRISPTGISRNYDVAQNDARSIEDSLGIAGAHVRYIGDGEFAVTGSVANKPDLDAAVARVRSDLDANVKNIAVQVAETSNVGPTGPDTASYSEMISSDDVKYAQTPDGVKHIYAIDPPDGASDAVASNPDSNDAGANAANAANAANTGGIVNATAQAPARDTGSANRANATNQAAKSNSTIVDGDTISRSAGVVPLPDPSTLPAGAHADARAD